jgi:hypothetical protein
MAEKLKTECYDCRLPYREFPLDALVHNDVWELIRPKGFEGDGGLLCPNCICKRLRKLGATVVFIRVAKQEIKSDL